jgi:sugar phosphate isomerase/epimerase
MKLGATSFAFRCLLRDARRAPPLERILELTEASGLQRLQICENARVLELSDEAWEAVRRQARRLNLEIHLGCKTLEAPILGRYLARARTIPSNTVRVVLEEDGGPPTRARAADFLEAVMPLLDGSDVRLALENHFDIPSTVLKELVEPYPSELIGFCVDSANSLRSFEPPLYVLDLLGPRAFCYHLKDYKVTGSDLGFSVSGAPLGAGDLQVDEFLCRIFAQDGAPEIYLENWVPSIGQWEADVEADAHWLHESVESLRMKVRSRETETEQPATQEAKVR